MAKANIFKFMQEVRDETQKVTWPTRRETAITTAMVFVMVAIAAVFFLVVTPVNRLMARRAQENPEEKECPECTSAIPIAARRCPQCTAQIAAAGAA